MGSISYNFPLKDTKLITIYDCLSTNIVEQINLVYFASKNPLIKKCKVSHRGKNEQSALRG